MKKHLLFGLLGATVLALGMSGSYAHAEEVDNNEAEVVSPCVNNAFGVAIDGGEETCYNSFSQAINAVSKPYNRPVDPDKNAVVTLYRDYDGSNFNNPRVTLGMNVTLNLNGYNFNSRRNYNIDDELTFTVTGEGSFVMISDFPLDEHLDEDYNGYEIDGTVYSRDAEEPITINPTEHVYNYGEEEEDMAISVSEDGDAMIESSVNEEVKAALGSELEEGQAYVSENAKFYDVAGLYTAIVEKQSITPVVASGNWDTTDITEVYANEEVAGLIEEKDTIVGVYYSDIYLYTEDANGRRNEIGWLAKTVNEAEVRLLIPEEYREAPAGYLRTFYVVVGHYAPDGTETAFRVEATLDGNEVVIKNQKFSDFVLIYQDTLLPLAPNTGVVTETTEEAKSASMVVYLAAAVAGLVAMGAVKFAKREM